MFKKGGSVSMELQNQQQVKAHLMATSEEFRLLAQKHAELDRRVTEMESQDYLSAQERLEEARLKKLKLYVKDLMNEQLCGALSV
jgi:uncharacterized protein YdcH (DUF465 family)